MYTNKTQRTFNSIIRFLKYTMSLKIGFVFIYVFLLFCFEESENWGNKTTKLRRETFGCLYSLLYYAIVV